MHVGSGLVRLAIWFCIALVYGCGVEQGGSKATQVIVEIDADETITALMHSLRVRVEGADGLDAVAEGTTRLDETVSPVELPKRVALAPLAGTADTRVFVLTATALDQEGALLAEARLISGYVAGQVRYARLVIAGSACLRVRCEDERSTCVQGVCTEASVDAIGLSEDGDAPTNVVFGGPEAGMGTIDAGDKPADPSAPSEAGPPSGDAQVDADTDAASPVAAVFELGSACARAGELGCGGYDSVLSLVCSGGAWRESLRCRSSERCDTRLGPNQGQCLDVLSECLDKRPGDPFCRGNQRMTCGADRVSAHGEACPAGQVCLLEGVQTSCAPDADECALGGDECDDAPDACRNTLGSFMCVCPSGYTGSGRGANGCVDQDECAPGAASACGPGAMACSNLPGSYQCTCQPGYSGTGSKACTDIDECAAGTVAACGAGATACDNQAGSFTCTCGAGYVGTGSRACVALAPPGGACTQASECLPCNPSTASVTCTSSVCVCANSATCSANNQCAGTCVGGRCVTADTSCDTRDDCRGSKLCVGASAGSPGRCVLPENSACSANNQCAGVCRPPDTEEGSSARFCQPIATLDLHCDENADCAAGLVCRNTTGVGLHCAPPAQ